MRKAKVERVTKETQIVVELNLDGEGKADIDTGIGFLDHMLNTFSKHSSIYLYVRCKGDLKVDMHHSVEDIGIVMGDAFNKALSSKEGINRYSSFVMPMDDSLVLCAIDLCGRNYYASNANDFLRTTKCGDFETETTDEFFRSFASNASMNLHFLVYRGDNAHHIIEAMFKAFAKNIKDAITINPNLKGSLSTKGVI